ncbi:cupin domain-containing protein [Oceanospirillum sanctuarii]|uniref:cupin domain-containing protein n=1 Tax=Oceanospirillum sanctuarii TaxID=1434821 RepID=UPI001C3E653D|nr:cupin domain-containing protein [Oceanospirillum sanctuarii]
MLVNTDFSVQVSVTPDKYEWSSSPQQGVQRVMLDRVGAEKGRATSIVRFEEGSGFPHHSHPGGEEILVLDGVFSESGKSYSSGWYLRNPPDSSHSPSSDCGATIFVKLWQMAGKKQPCVRINIKDKSNWYFSEGRDTCPLYKDDSENVLIERLAANVSLFKEPVVGAEVLVLEGSL